MTGGLVRQVVALALATLFCLDSVSVAAAQVVDLAPTVLTIEPLEPIPLGDHPTVVVQLVTVSGEPLPGQEIRVTLNDDFEHRSRTDQNGFASVPIKRDLAAGSYRVEAEFRETAPYLASKAEIEMTIQPVELEVRTIPELSGILFSLDDRPFRSGDDGVARLMVEEVGLYRIAIQTPEEANQGFRTEFKRWEPDVFTPVRDVRIPATTVLEIGFEVTHLVNFSFVDRAGRAVDPDRISSFSLKSSNGGSVTFEDAQPKWLLSNRVVRRLRGLESVDLVYSVQSVIVDGSNVVNQGQQRYLVTQDGSWQIELLLYSAQINAKDGIFGFPVGSGILLEYPDGRTQELSFNQDRVVKLESLARGLYHVRAMRAPGIAFSTPVVISRDQEVELLVLSYPTIAIAVLLPVSLALLLLFIGRPELYNALRARTSVRLGQPRVGIMKKQR